MPPLERVNALESPWHLLGAAMRHWRTEVGEKIGLRTVAARAYVDTADLSKWERGLAHPHPDAVARIDEILGADGQLVAIRAVITELERAQTLAKDTLAKRDDEDMERRRLLLAAAASAGLGVVHSATGESIRQLADMTLPDPRGVDDWHLAVLDHLHAIRTRPALQVAQDLVVDLLEVQRQIERTGSGSADLHRVLAMLGAFHSSVLIRLGDHGPALRWYRTARNAADTSGDLNLLLHIHAHEAEHVQNGVRSPEVVLAMIDKALGIGGYGTSSGAALLHRSRAQALSRLDRHKEALDALHTLQDMAEVDMPVLPGFWEPAIDNRILYSQSMVYSRRGDEKAAAEARDQILARPVSYEAVVMVKFHEALCLIRRGDIDRGARHAATVLDACPTKYRNNMLLQDGRSVLEAIPSNEQHRPAVNELRHILTSGV